MYNLISRAPLSAIASRELPALGISLIIAELFYKFHSFTLECGAFLLTWYGLSWVADRALTRRRG